MSQLPIDEFEIDQRKQHLAAETACIAWSELERFFAQGKVIYVAQELDLVEAAARISLDDKNWVEPRQEQIQLLPAEIALQWVNNKQDVWCVVIAPWIVVQEAQAIPKK